MDLKPATKSYDRPQILSLASSRVDQWCSQSWKWLERLRIVVLNRVSVNLRRSTRTIRCDQRQSIARLLKVILYYTDLKTMQIGFYHHQSQTFVHLSLEFLAKKADLPMRRAQRAMQWLYQSGYISGFRKSSYDAQTGEYKHKPSVRVLNTKLLFDLGIKEFALQRARARSEKRQRKYDVNQLIRHKVKESSFTPKQQLVKNQLRSITDNLQLNKPKSNQKPPEAYLAKLKQMLQLFPDLSKSEATSMLPSPEAYL